MLFYGNGTRSGSFVEFMGQTAFVAFEHTREVGLRTKAALEANFLDGKRRLANQFGRFADSCPVEEVVGIRVEVDREEAAQVALADAGLSGHRADTERLGVVGANIFDGLLQCVGIVLRQEVFFQIPAKV